MGKFSKPSEYKPPVGNQREILEARGWKFSKTGKTHKAIKGSVILTAEGCCFKRIAAMVMAWEVKHGS